MNNLNKYKRDRVENTISRALSEIICYELKSELCKLASINEVRFNDDFSLCKVYVVHLDDSKSEVLTSFLNTKKKTIRALLAKRMDIYKIPDLVFIRDELYAQARKIDILIDKVKNEKLKTLKDLEKKKRKSK